MCVYANGYIYHTDMYVAYICIHNIHLVLQRDSRICITYILNIIEGSLEVKLPTIWTDEKQSREEAERRERSEERRVEEKESEERRCRCAKR